MRHQLVAHLKEYESVSSKWEDGPGDFDKELVVEALATGGNATLTLPKEDGWIVIPVREIISVHCVNDDADEILHDWDAGIKELRPDTPLDSIEDA